MSKIIGVVQIEIPTDVADGWVHTAEIKEMRLVGGAVVVKAEMPGEFYGHLKDKVDFSYEIRGDDGMLIDKGRSQATRDIEALVPMFFYIRTLAGQFG